MREPYNKARTMVKATPLVAAVRADRREVHDLYGPDGAALDR